ncbi:MAG: EF-P beta-lysylation protein EpmB [Fibrobacterota bacterium]|nr:MAG: EF-P beta-lysylation protein EpmB [Fibrobacterota bacterium]
MDSRKGPSSRMDWTDQLREAFRHPARLAEHLGIPLGSLPPLSGKPAFPMLVPRAFAQRMERGDPRDPLLLQVWPDQAELEPTADESTDPVGDGLSVRTPGLLQKYRSRALVVTTGACAIHCRYCFRQEFPYNQSTSDWEPRIAYLRDHPEIDEVVLSGGDPLMLGNGALERIWRALEGIPHLRTLRLHTRLPVVLPDRVDEGFEALIRSSRLRVAVVIHSNHAKELDGQVEEAISKLLGAGATVLNQSVLLARINDDVATLHALSARLWDIGVLPYYLHALDRVRGAGRFFVPDSVAVDLIERLRERTSGYLVPRLVREIEGEPSKTPLA